MKALAGVAILTAAVMALSSCRGKETGGSGASKKDYISWDQPMSASVDPSRYRFAVYIDDAERVELPDANCSSPVGNIALCSSPLPQLSRGTHRLALVSYILPERVDSPRATAIEFTVTR